MSAGINSMSTEASPCSVCNCTGACRPVSQGGKGRCSSAPTSVLEPGAARLIAAEHLLSQVLPNVNQYDRLKLVCEIRDLLDGTTAVGEVAS